MTRVAWHGDVKFRQQMIDAAIAHRKADEYVSGTYRDKRSETFRGCSVGCSVNDVRKIRGLSNIGYNNHDALAEALGFPGWLTRLQDQLFETLPTGSEEQRRWTETLFSAIPVGADLEPIGYELAARCLERSLERIGEGSELWREKCRKVVKPAIAVTRSVHPSSRAPSVSPRVLPAVPEGRWFKLTSCIWSGSKEGSNGSW